ncbi:transcription factor grauzone-like [Wyeomyia smithii]|uniref:transcription factor grauzone-like n=1 Tax=Wyeomyia smithii TaxID=174621 RepID=UPI002467CEEA|nr:transcription factor grauzone-like [Wyeomyia smithii]
MSEVRPCLTCFRKTDNYLRIADDTNADDVERIVTTHFWFSENECFQSVLCTSCWEKIDDFHKFYCEVKRAHLELSDTIEVQIKVEALEQPLDSVKREDDAIATATGLEVVHVLATNEKQGESSATEVKDELKTEEKPIRETPIKPKGRRGRKRKVSFSESEDDKEPAAEMPMAESGAGQENECFSTSDESEWEPPQEDDSGEELKKLKQRRTRTVKQPRKKYAPRKPRKATEERATNGKTKEEIAKEDEFIRKYCPIFCHKCEFNSDTFGELQTHTKRVHNCNPMIVCCEHKFYKRSFLYQHAQYHENPDMFRCEPCKKTFISGLALKLHLDYTHVAEEEKIYKCEICQASFAKHYHLTSHRMKHTSIAEKRFYCEPCDIAFRTNQSYRTHQHSKHGAAAKYVCDICARGFRQRSDLVTHQLSHSAEGLEQLKIQCEHCHKWMKNKKSIWTHRRICQSSGPVACDICGKMAPNPEQLKSHKKFMHQDQRVHQCGYCEKAFKRPIDLKEHETIHTGEVLYTCNFCPKTFNSNSNLYSHRRKMHPIEYAEWKLALQLKKRPASQLPAGITASTVVTTSSAAAAAAAAAAALVDMPPFLPPLMPSDGYV